MVFAGLEQYPKSSPLACRYSHHFFTPASDPTAELSSACHTCFTSSFVFSLLSACTNGHVDRAYIAIAALSTCVLWQYVVPHFPDKAWWVCCSCCVGMCTWRDTVLWWFLDWLVCWVCWRHCPCPLAAGIQILSSSWLFLTACIAASMPNSSPAHVCSVPTASLHVWCLPLAVLWLFC